MTRPPAFQRVAERTTYRWLARYDAHEPTMDRSSQPRHSPTRTPRKIVVIERLRRPRKTSSTIAPLLKMAVSTVCAVLKRLGLTRLSTLDPVEPPNRYRRRHPGELAHLGHVDTRLLSSILGATDRPSSFDYCLGRADRGMSG